MRGRRTDMLDVVAFKFGKDLEFMVCELENDYIAIRHSVIDVDVEDSGSDLK